VYEWEKVFKTKLIEDMFYILNAHIKNDKNLIPKLILQKNSPSLLFSENKRESFVKGSKFYQKGKIVLVQL
jgi:hypothetical protein